MTPTKVLTGPAFTLKETKMEAWRTVLREGFLPSLSTAGLESLRAALERDDPRLLQNATTNPPPLIVVQNWPCEGACFVAWAAGWMGGENPACSTVGETEEAFARACFDADQRLGEAAACRWFLNFWDDCPRSEARRETLFEIERELGRRDALVREGTEQVDGVWGVFP